MKINLQHKTKAKPGTAEFYWFENENIGLGKTLFHRISIPLEPFDSGLEYVSQPEETALIIEWLKLELKDPTKLDGLSIKSEDYEDVEGSIYIGAAHNWTDINNLTLKLIDENLYELVADLFVDFSHEGVADSENFKISTQIKFKGEA